MEAANQQLRRNEWLLAVGISLLLLIPCFWQPLIIAGDLDSHVYNAWLARQIERLPLADGGEHARLYVGNIVRMQEEIGTGGGGFRSWGINTAKLRERMATVKTIPRWTLHDLRRTMRTGLGRLGVEPHIAELVIGHAKKGIVGDL